MTDSLSLPSLRRGLGHTWLIALFGIAYAISQITIIVILEPIADAMIKLQMTGVSVGDYLTVFRDWEESGGMGFYRAHFILDDVHWIWYAGFFTALLCRLFERVGVGHKYDWVLVLPLGSGLLDWYENHLQHVFLSAPDFATSRPAASVQHHRLRCQMVVRCHLRSSLCRFGWRPFCRRKTVMDGMSLGYALVLAPLFSFMVTRGARHSGGRRPLHHRAAPLRPACGEGGGARPVDAA